MSYFLVFIGLLIIEIIILTFFISRTLDICDEDDTCWIACDMTKKW